MRAVYLPSSKECAHQCDQCLDMGAILAGGMRTPTQREMKSNDLKRGNGGDGNSFVHHLLRICSMPLIASIPGA